MTNKQLWQLTVVDGPDSGRKFSAGTGDTLVVGRGNDSDTQIQDPKMSRVHCEVRFERGATVVVDRNGSGGTFVDGVRVSESHAANAGAVLRVGDSRIRLDRAGALDAPTRTGDDEFADAAAKLKKVNVSALAGKKFQNYHLDELISSSRNSVVYKATDQDKGGKVAIKVLKPQMVTTDTQRERFIRAMKTMLKVDHPNIVRIRKAGRTGPFCWVALDWVQGTSVAKLIERIGISGMLDWKQVWRVAVHVGRALDEANKLEIVHRNVTPSNILRKDDDKSFLLTDLIFARALEQTEAQQLTRPGDIIGDMGYMAPERIFDSTFMDARSDQYSLGATLYALLTGEPPFAAHSVGDLIQQIQNTTPKAPTEFQMGMDERFSDLVMKLISKTPEKRFASARDLLRDLERVGKLGGIDADWSAWVG